MGFRAKFQIANSIADLDTKVTNELAFTEAIDDFRIFNIMSSVGEYIVCVIRLAVNMASTVFVGSGLDDGTYSGTFIGDTDGEYFVTIDASVPTPDTFTWRKDIGGTAGTESASIGITGSAQLLDEDVSITFGAIDGHTVNDLWKVQVESEA